MTPDRGGSPRPDDLDGGSGYGTPVPVASADREAFDELDQLVESATEESAVAVQDAARSALSGLRTAQTEVRTVLSELLGTVDGGLGALQADQSRVIERLYRSAMTDIYTAQADLRSAGVFVPGTTDEHAADLADDTGGSMFARLAGEPPGAQPDPRFDDGSDETPATGRLPPRDPAEVGAPPRIPPRPEEPPEPGMVPCEINSETGAIEWCRPGPGGSIPPPVAPPPPPPSPSPPPVPLPPPAGEPGSCPPCESPAEDETVCVPLSEAKICIPRDRIGTPVPPPPPPAPPDEEEEEEEEEPGGVVLPEEPRLPAPPAFPKLPPAPVTTLPYHDPRICAEIAGWVDWFGKLGLWMQKTVDYVSVQADEIIQAELAERAFANVVGVWAGIVETVSGSAEGLLALVNLARQTQGFILQRLAGAVRDGAWKTVKDWHQTALGADGPAMYGCLAARSLLQWVGSHFSSWSSEYLGADTIAMAFDPLERIVSLCILWLAPVEPPQLPDVQRLWLTGVITDDHAACLVRLHGQQWPITQAAWLTGRTRPTVYEVMQLWRKGRMDDRGRDFALRELGVTDAFERGAYQTLTEYNLQFPDIIRCMVRDSFDEGTVRRYGYDDEFDAKYTGQAEQLGRAIGLTRETARLLWRAHWVIPSNTALYEMLHRLRPDRPEVEEWARAQALWAAGGAEGIPPVPPQVVSLEDVREALRVNDNAPRWVEPLIAISYRTITRTDATNAYHAGAWNDEQLYHNFRDNGQSERDARFAVDIQRTIRGRRLANVSGVWTTRQVIKAYKDGSTDRLSADLLLRETIPDGHTRITLLNSADQQVAADVRAGWVKRARRAYFVGEWTPEETAANLRANGVDQGRAAQLIELWTAEVRGRYREPTARQIIQWAALAIITDVDAYNRLIRLGYSDIDARRIVYQGIDAYRARLTAAADKQTAKVRAIIKDAKQAKKEQTAELEKRRKEAEKEKERLEEELDRIRGELDRRRPQ